MAESEHQTDQSVEDQQENLQEPNSPPKRWSFGKIGPVVKVALIFLIVVIVLAFVAMFYTGNIKSKYKVAKSNLDQCTSVVDGNNFEIERLIAEKDALREEIETMRSGVEITKMKNEREKEKLRDEIKEERRLRNEIYDQEYSCADWYNMPVCDSIFERMRLRSNSRHSD